MSEMTDALAQEIRRVDGNHTMGAGALAEALMPFIARLRGEAAQGEQQAVACAHINVVKGNDGVRWCQHCEQQLDPLPPAAPAPVAGEAVAWRVRWVDPEEGPRVWRVTDVEEHAQMLARNGHEVVPLAALEQDRAAQAGAAGVPEGWRLVPVEATRKMIAAAISAQLSRECQWRAMLAAAPAAPTQGAEREVGHG